MDPIAIHLYRLGGADHPCFLVTGADSSVLIDAGPAFMAPTYRKEIERLLGQDKSPDWLFLTHFHYDHVGGAPYLRRHFPAMQTAGSAKLGRMLTRGKIASRVRDFNHRLMTEHRTEEDIDTADIDYGALSLDRILEDGDVVDLGGGVAIEAMAAPGHTQDNLSFFLPHVDAAVTAEAVGIIPGDEFWVAPQFLSSYEDYLDTIKRIRRRGPKILVLGHHRMVAEKDVDRFFEAARADCRQYRKMIEQYLQEERMMEEAVVRRLLARQVRTGRRGRQPEAAYLLNLQVQVKLIARRLRRENEYSPTESTR
jgi:glyoxylase-like metal-dependent hydrolase (beta-lactamase superfamily II)